MFFDVDKILGSFYLFCPGFLILLFAVMKSKTAENKKTDCSDWFG